MKNFICVFYAKYYKAKEIYWDEICERSEKNTILFSRHQGKRETT